MPETPTPDTPTPDTTASGRGWRTLTPAAAPGSLVAGESLPPAFGSGAPPDVTVEAPVPRASEPLPEALSPGAVAPDEPPARAGPRVRAGAGAAPDDADDTSEAEPGEPVVSAAAIGTVVIAEPTPNATARAPTRPTNLA